MTARDELEADSRTSWGTAKPAAEDDRWTARHQVELHRVLTAEAQQHPSLPPNWQAWAEQEPELSARHELAALILLGVTAVLVLLVVGRIVWQGISTVVGL